MKVDDLDRDQLVAVIRRLERENASLRSINDAYLKAVVLQAGAKGESLVARWVMGKLTSNNESHDVYCDGVQIRIEVKFSALCTLEGKPTTRWQWSKPFGDSGNKVYDRLVLIGVRDERFLGSYLPSEFEFVVFDIPYAEVWQWVNRAKRYPLIQLTSNPRRQTSRIGELYERHQVTGELLEARYQEAFATRSPAVAVAATP